MSKTSQKKRKKTTGWGRKLANSFVRNGAHRFIYINDENGINRKVFIGVTKSGSLSVQLHNGIPDSQWKELNDSKWYSHKVRSGGAK
jgi:hypothetical protein